jgi:hypothetical protein
MNEEVNGDAVHEVRFRKGGSLTGQPADSLAQGAVEAFGCPVGGWLVGPRFSLCSNCAAGTTRAYASHTSAKQRAAL